MARDERLREGAWNFLFTCQVGRCSAHLKITSTSVICNRGRGIELVPSSARRFTRSPRRAQIREDGIRNTRWSDHPAREGKVWVTVLWALAFSRVRLRRKRPAGMNPGVQWRAAPFYRRICPIRSRCWSVSISCSISRTMRSMRRRLRSKATRFAVVRVEPWS